MGQQVGVPLGVPVATFPNANGFNIDIEHPQKIILEISYTPISFSYMIL